MDAERLKEIRTRASDAALGPWDTLDYEETVYQEGSGHEICAVYGGGNAVFIAAARSDVPDLLAYIDELHARIADLEHTPQPDDFENYTCTRCPITAFPSRRRMMYCERHGHQLKRVG